jgi:sulfur-oxidizing protein SoxX
MQLRSSADALSPEWINGEIPVSLSGQPGDPLRGRQIIVNRQTGLCLLCHQGPFPEERFQGTLAPELSGSVAKMSPGRLRAQIVDASRFNPDTIMPPYFRTDHLNRVAAPYVGRTLLQAQDIEDVVAFLITLKK